MPASLNSRKRSSMSSRSFVNINLPFSGFSSGNPRWANHSAHTCCCRRRASFRRYTDFSACRRRIFFARSSRPLRRPFLRGTRRSFVSPRCVNTSSLSNRLSECFHAFLDALAEAPGSPLIDVSDEQEHRDYVRRFAEIPLKKLG